MMFKQFVSVSLLTVSLGGLVSCSSSKVADKTDTKTTSSALSTTKKNSNSADAVPTGTLISTDLQQELSTGKNRNNDKFSIKIQNNSVNKYPALKDATIEGHLEDVVKAAKGKKAKLNLVFDSVKLKSGELIEINADLVNTKIETKTKGKFLQNAGIILGGTVAGSFLGDKTKFKHGKLAGAAAATAFVLSSPGGEVVLKKGTDIQLKLKSSLDPS